MARNLPIGNCSEKKSKEQNKKYYEETKKMRYDLVEKKSGPLGRFFQDFDSLMGDFFHEGSWDRFRGDSFSPRVDIQESEDRIIVEAELPGMNEKDIRVEVKDRVLSIEGEKGEDSESKDKKNYRIERRYGKFIRSFRLPEEVQVEKVKASYKNGVLSLELPKDKKQSAQKIQIELKSN